MPERKLTVEQEAARETLKDLKKFAREIIDRIIFYPSQPLFGSFRLFRDEIRRVVEYGKSGDLSWSPPE